MDVAASAKPIEQKSTFCASALSCRISTEKQNKLYLFVLWQHLCFNIMISKSRCTSREEAGFLGRETVGKMFLYFDK